MFHRFFLVYNLILIFLFAPFLAWADNPVITSFTVSPASINSGQFIGFSWTLQNAGGYSLLIPCVSGVKITDSNGNQVPCDQRFGSTVATSAGISFIVHNVSGGTVNLTARLYPKSASGQDYEAGVSTVSFSVAALAQPISSFTAATTTVSGQPFTVSWSASNALSGVNIQLSCQDPIKVFLSAYYSSGAQAPCNRPLFDSDQGISGSASFNFQNPSLLAIPYRITLLPAISPRVYDGTHARNLDFMVVSDVKPDPAITALIASSTALNSGEEILVSWASANAASVNFQISCVNSLTATSSLNPNLVLPCDKLAFQDGLSTTTALKFSFQNNSVLDQLVTILAGPARSPGQYDFTLAKSLVIKVRPASAPLVFANTVLSQNAAAIPATSASASASSSIAANQISASGTKSAKFAFTKLLKRGSQGNEVRALQEFFKKDSAIYPEGVVNGTFGPATERAVKRFQVKYGIARPGVSGYGQVGPATRAKLNSSR